MAAGSSSALEFESLCVSIDNNCCGDDDDDSLEVGDGVVAPEDTISIDSLTTTIVVVASLPTTIGGRDVAGGKEALGATTGDCVVGDVEDDDDTVAAEFIYSDLRKWVMSFDANKYDTFPF